MTNLLPFHQIPCYHLSSSSSQLFSRGRSMLGITSNNNIFTVSHQHRVTTIKCMANPRRVAMVAKQIRRELSDMLLTDKNLQYAVLPEAALGADRYLSSVTTISDVQISADLQVFFIPFFLSLC